MRVNLYELTRMLIRDIDGTGEILADKPVPFP